MHLGVNISNALQQLESVKAAVDQSDDPKLKVCFLAKNGKYSLRKYIRISILMRILYITTCTCTFYLLQNISK